MMSRASVMTGYSLEASAAQTDDKIGRVQAVIMAILAEHGPQTHDDLCDRYHERAGRLSSVPNVTDQSVRTRTAELARRGLVRAAEEPGRSHHGYKATRWVLA
jgi:predicted ArsR family transcriptional regulator